MDGVTMKIRIDTGDSKIQLDELRIAAEQATLSLERLSSVISRFQTSDRELSKKIALEFNKQMLMGNFL